MGPGAPLPGDAPWPDPWNPEIPPPHGRRLLDAAAVYGPFLLLLAAVIVPLALLLWSADSTPELTAAELGLLEANSREATPVRGPATTAGPRDAPAETAATAWLRISSFPLGATVWIDGDSIGVTPLTLPEVVAGLHAVAVDKADYVRQDSLLHVAGGTYASLLFALTRTDQPVSLPQPRSARTSSQPALSPVEDHAATGALIITSEPSGAMVWMDDQRIGSTPAQLEAVPVGQHLITLRMDGYESYTREVEVRPEARVMLQGTLIEATGTVSLLVHPWGSIYIDGALHQQDTDVMYHTTLPAGIHRIRAVHPALGSLERMVKIEAGEAVELVLDLNEAVRSELAARAESLATPITRPAATQDENGVYVITDTPPAPVGGPEALHRGAVYPAIARQMGIEGRVYVRFIVDEQGRVHDAFVVRGIGGGCDGEALRLISQARFHPATVAGQPVASWHTLFITFKLDP